MKLEKPKNMTNEVHALRKIRECKGLNRKQAAIHLGVSNKQIEKIENGRANLAEVTLNKILASYNVSKEDFQLLCQGQSADFLKKYASARPNIIQQKQLRRSYQKLQSKEARVLKAMRRLKKYPQQRASILCGYPRCTIGHIENGRIELPSERVRHIYRAYGYSNEEFQKMMNSSKLRDEIQENCLRLIEGLTQEKLEIVQTLLNSFNN